MGLMATAPDASAQSFLNKVKRAASKTAQEAVQKTKQDAVNKAKQEVADLTDEAVGILQDLPYENPFLTELLRWLVRRDK